MTDVTMQIIEIGACALPFDHIDADLWTVRVSWRGGNQYSVQHLSKVLNKDGEWEHEPIPSSRSDQFKARTRFDYHAACRLAVEQARAVTINGLTAADMLARQS